MTFEPTFEAANAVSASTSAARDEPEIVVSQGEDWGARSSGTPRYPSLPSHVWPHETSLKHDRSRTPQGRGLGRAEWRSGEMIVR
jgi:hypothetical protein